MSTLNLTAPKDLLIVSPTTYNSKPVPGSQLVGKALELMIYTDPAYDTISQSFSIPEDQNITKNKISLCSLEKNMGVLFNWTSLDTKEEYSVVVLTRDIEFYREIKKCFDKKTNFII